MDAHTVSYTAIHIVPPPTKKIMKNALLVHALCSQREKTSQL